MTAVQSERAEFKLSDLPDLWVAIYPRAAYSSLRTQSRSISRWQSVQRSFLIAFVIGNAMTLIASSPLSIWLVVSTTLYWSVVPMVELLALLVVLGKPAQEMRRAQLIDLYFTGHATWLLWFVLLAIVWSLLIPIQASSLAFVHARWLASITALVVLWSAYVDYCYFRVILGRSRGRSCRDLAIQRLISWALLIAIFNFGSFWTVVAPLVSR